MKMLWGVTSRDVWAEMICRGSPACALLRYCFAPLARQQFIYVWLYLLRLLQLWVRACLVFFRFVLLCFALLCLALLCFVLFGFVVFCYVLFCVVLLCFVFWGGVWVWEVLNLSGTSFLTSFLTSVETGALIVEKSFFDFLFRRFATIASADIEPLCFFCLAYQRRTNCRPYPHGTAILDVVGNPGVGLVEFPIYTWIVRVQAGQRNLVWVSGGIL